MRARRLNLRWRRVPWRVHRWITDRCAGCGRRFLWRDVRHSYPSSDRVWHEVCMSLLQVRGQLDDLTAYVRFSADATAKWRVEHRLQGLDRLDATASGQNGN